MTISIIHPTRGRKQQAIKTANTWLSKAVRKHNIEYILSVDVDDPDFVELQNMGRDRLIVIGSDNKGAVDAINAGAAISTGGLLIAVSDDFDCPQDWDALLLHALQGRSDYVVKTQDGCQPWILTLPIMDRNYYNRFGYIYYPGYKHMFCDCEAAHVGDLLGRTITLPLPFPHHHYTQIGGQPKDAINVKNDATWDQGEELYLRRLADNFGLPKELTCEVPAHHRHWLLTKGVTI